MDDSCLSRAFDEHAQEVFRFVLRRCHDPIYAEDCVSVVFLEAWRSRSRAVQVDGSLRPWLFGIAINVMRNAGRAEHRHRAALSRFHAQTCQDYQVTPDHADVVARRVDRGYDRAELAIAFDQLSSKLRGIADLCLIEGLNSAQVANVLNLPEGTVKSRLASARVRLQLLLQRSEVG